MLVVVWRPVAGNRTNKHRQWKNHGQLDANLARVYKYTRDCRRTSYKWKYMIGSSIFDFWTTVGGSHQLEEQHVDWCDVSLALPRIIFGMTVNSNYHIMLLISVSRDIKHPFFTSSVQVATNDAARAAAIHSSPNKLVGCKFLHCYTAKHYEKTLFEASTSIAGDCMA